MSRDDQFSSARFGVPDFQEVLMARMKVRLCFAILGRTEKFAKQEIVITTKGASPLQQ